MAETKSNDIDRRIQLAKLETHKEIAAYITDQFKQLREDVERCFDKLPCDKREKRMEEQDKKIDKTDRNLWILIGTLAGLGVLGGSIFGLFNL